MTIQVLTYLCIWVQHIFIESVLCSRNWYICTAWHATGILQFTGEETRLDLRASFMYVFLFHGGRTCSTTTKVFLGLMFKPKLKAHLQTIPH